MKDLIANEVQLLQKCSGKHTSVSELFECESCKLLFQPVQTANCPRCDGVLEPETEVTQYKYYCPECDENMC